MYTPEEIAVIKAKFGMGNEVDYSLHCDNLIGFEGKDILQIGGSYPEEFVFNILKVNSWSAVEFPERLSKIKGDEIKNHRGAVLNKEKVMIHEGFGEPLKNKYNIFLADAHEIPKSHFEMYDMVFSINSFHHILHFPKALNLMHAALKPEGKLFSIFSPIWSSCNGHNIEELMPHTKLDQGMIPPWGHLVMKVSSMFEHLKEKSDEDIAAEIVYHIYNNPNINRYLTEDYLNLIKLSKFNIEKFDALFNRTVAPYSQHLLEQMNPGCKSFGNSGLLIALTK